MFFDEEEEARGAGERGEASEGISFFDEGEGRGGAEEAAEGEGGLDGAVFSDDIGADEGPGGNGNGREDEEERYGGMEEGDRSIREAAGGAGLIEEGVIEQAGEEEGFSTEDREEKGFIKKESADEVFGKRKRGGLNKNRIIGSIVVCISVFMTAAVVHLFWQEKKEEGVGPKKKSPSANQLANYENMAELIEEGELGSYENGSGEAGKADSVEGLQEESLPPIPALDEKRYESGTSVPAGGTAAKPRPDTSANRLQARSIPGIKGLSGTERNMPTGGTVKQDANTNPYAQFGMPSKEEYMGQMLSMYGNQGAYAGGSGYERQNGWQQKNNFYTQDRENTGSGQWLPPNTVLMGSIFSVELMNNINTDLPGSVTGRVVKNVYSADGKYVLIPQGSLVIGEYNSAISYAQSRVQVGWHTLIRPDLYQVNLGNMEGADVQGAAGLKGFINDHPVEYLKAFGLLSFVNLVNLEFKNQIGDYADNEYVQNILADAQGVSNQLGSKIVERALNIQPTITIKAGTVINVVVNVNLTLPAIEPYPVEEAYRRR